MKSHLQKWLCLISIFLICKSISFSQTLPQFTLQPNSPERIFSFTNKHNAFYCGVANANNSSGFYGITQSKEKLFENFWIKLGDEILNRKEAVVTLTPWKLIRTYARYNTKEEIFFADSLTLLIVRITSDYKGAVTFIPGLSNQWQNASTNFISDQQVMLNGKMICIATAYQVEGKWNAGSKEIVKQLKNPTQLFVPFVFSSEQFSGTAAFTIEFSKSAFLSSRNLHDLNLLESEKHNRITDLIATSKFSSNNETMDQVYPWILSSMDALIMKNNLYNPDTKLEDDSFGIWAGLPWFDDFWGRDTFISLPGALLVTGEFEKAKKVLQSFLKYQNNISSNPDYGRIPNRITPTDIAYNTVDGTPWFVHQVYEYILYSGDVECAEKIFPAIERATNGTIKFRIDKSGFINHTDAETWMDAVGEKGAWSPRGNRAVEVQALWISQLESSAAIANLLKKNNRADEWNALAKQVRDNFSKQFIIEKEGILADRIQFSNAQDTKIRPNSLIALNASLNQIVNDKVAYKTIKNIFESCAYKYGVASLSQNDNDFHPFHQYPGYYPKDAAYHNGVIWTWLNGPAISLLCRYGLQDSAFYLTDALNHLALEQGQLGSLPELTDAIARVNEYAPRWSGTFSQAWSLAEYVRNLFQDYLGIRPNALNKEVTLSPRLPKSMLRTECNFRVGSSLYHVKYDFTNQSKNECIISRIHGMDSLKIHLYIDNKNVITSTTFDLPIQESSSLSVIYDRDKNAFASENKMLPNESKPFPITPDERKSISFCTPFLRSDLSSIKKPNHAMLDGALVCSKNPKAKLLFQKNDPEGDDAGLNRSYSYPKNIYFQKGIFDIKSLTVTTDNEMIYFTIEMKKLVQPGWHPEYGFQLTMLALAIDIDGIPRSGNRYIRHNARVILPNDMWYERLILIGGGIQVFDKNENILAEYIPVDEKFPIGNIETEKISFALPVHYFSKPNEHWDYYLVSGGQDDHGGGGIGEFRSVFPESTEWNGGGNTNDGPNIYDVLSSR